MLYTLVHLAFLSTAFRKFQNNKKKIVLETYDVSFRRTIVVQQPFAKYNELYSNSNWQYSGKPFTN